MTHVIQTETLVDEGVLTPEQGAIIASRSRQVMVSLAINVVLCFGILAAAGGFIGFLGDALAVAVTGGLFLGLGLAILGRGAELYRMFGSAAALIGAGMLIGGASVKLVELYEPGAGGLAMAIAGLPALMVAGWAFRRAGDRTGFLIGSIVVMCAAMHLIGLTLWASAEKLTGLGAAACYLYTAVMVFGLGVFVNVRFVTALAILPFAQMLDTGTYYFGAVYAFYSPESTLTILQMGLVMAVCVYLATRLDDRIRRHSHIFGIMAFITANLAALVGSIWGDVVGSHLWGPKYADFDVHTDYSAAREAFKMDALTISADIYAVLWGILLVAAIVWAAATNRRGVFNAALTFAAIHAYTQMFESFGDEPLAYVIGGLAAIPLAWGIWRLNERFETQS